MASAGNAAFAASEALSIVLAPAGCVHGHQRFEHLTMVRYPEIKKFMNDDVIVETPLFIGQILRECDDDAT